MNYRVIYPQDQILIHSPKIVKLLYTMYTCVYVLFFVYRCICRFTTQRYNYWFSLKMEYFE